MQEIKQKDHESIAIPKTPTVKRKIGKTTYEVSLHFSNISTENVQDKLRRIILNDCNSLKNLPSD